MDSEHEDDVDGAAWTREERGRRGSTKVSGGIVGRAREVAACAETGGGQDRIIE